MAERLSQYKNVGKDSESLRKTRLDQTINLRKDKREETLSKRRNIPSAEYAFHNGVGQKFSMLNSISHEVLVRSSGATCGESVFDVDLHIYQRSGILMILSKNVRKFRKNKGHKKLVLCNANFIKIVVFWIFSNICEKL